METVEDKSNAKESKEYSQIREYVKRIGRKYVKMSVNYQLNMLIILPSMKA